MLDVFILPQRWVELVMISYIKIEYFLLSYQSSPTEQNT